MLDRLRRAWGAFRAPQSAPRASQRAYFAAAKWDRLYHDVLKLLAVDGEIKADFGRLRSRSRDLARDSAYLKRYLAQAEANIIGPDGIRLEHRALSPRGKALDALNLGVETAWEAWGKVGACTIDGRYSWTDVQRMAVRTEDVDGEFLARIIRGADNPFGFALQLLDPDQLDQTYNRAASVRENEIRLGVEVDRWGKPVAYWLWTQHPRDFQSRGNRERVRVPASDIIHLFEPHRVGATRGVPRAHAVTLQLGMLDKYEEAELIAARLGSEKMGFITSQVDPDAAGVQEGEDVVIESEPGSFHQLPPGFGVQTWDPQHPNANFGAFLKSLLRRVAAGLGVSYNLLSNDLEGVNFSSIRQAVLDERDQWRMRQRRLAEQFHDRVFREWFPSAAFMGAFSLPTPEPERWCRPTWKFRGWSWVDPLKDVQAKVLAIANGLESRTSVVGETGRDVADVLRELSEELALADSLDLRLAGGTPAEAPNDKEADGASEEDHAQAA